MYTVLIFLGVLWLVQLVVSYLVWASVNVETSAEVPKRTDNYKSSMVDSTSDELSDHGYNFKYNNITEG